MRRPARLERIGALMPRDLMWAAMRKFAGTGLRFSVAEIMVLATASRAGGADTAPLKECTVAAYCDSLVKGGYLAPTQPPHPLAEHHRCMRGYIVQRDCGAHAPHLDRDGKPTRGDNPERQQMWNCVRKMKGDFNRRELMLEASIDECVISDDQAKFFCAQLERAGYLQAVGVKRRHVLTRYRFVRARDSGPRPPVIGKDLSVMDGNTGEIIAAAPAKGARS